MTSDIDRGAEGAATGSGARPGLPSEISQLTVVPTSISDERKSFWTHFVPIEGFDRMLEARSRCNNSDIERGAEGAATGSGARPGLPSEISQLTVVPTSISDER